MSVVVILDFLNSNSSGPPYPGCQSSGGTLLGAGQIGRRGLCLLGGGGVLRRHLTSDPNPPRHRPATAFRLPFRHHVYCTHPFLLHSDDPFASGAPHHCVNTNRKRRRTSRYINTWSVQRRPRLPYRIVDFRAAGWATTPCASGSSRPGPGNSGFYPPSTLRGRTGALVRGVCLLADAACQRRLVCLGAVARLRRRELDCFPRLLLPFDLTDSRTRVRAALSSELKAWAGGILLWPRLAEPRWGSRF